MSRYEIYMIHKLKNGVRGHTYCHPWWCTNQEQVVAHLPVVRNKNDDDIRQKKIVQGLNCDFKEKKSAANIKIQMNQRFKATVMIGRDGRANLRKNWQFLV